VKAVLAAMAHGEVGVAVEGGAALKTLAQDVPSAAVILATGLPTIRAAMDASMRNAEVQWRGLECLFYLCTTGKGCKQVIDANFMPIIGDVAKRHGKFELPGRWLLGLWSALLTHRSDPTFRGEVIAQSAVQIAEMRAFRHDVQRGEWSREVLAKLQE
jgi:hypothetical protein